MLRRRSSDMQVLSHGQCHLIFRRGSLGVVGINKCGSTVNATDGGDNQTSGASFRIIANLADWDRSVGTNTPGQSGDPRSPHYRDLFELWATGEYFPLAWSRASIEAVTGERLRLNPR